MVTWMLELGRLAPAADLDRVLLGLAIGNVLVGRVWQSLERVVALGRSGGEQLLALAQLLLDLLQLLDLLGRRLALQLLAGAEVVDLRHQLAPALVGGEPAVEVLCGALPRERGPIAVGVVARGLRVDQMRRYCFWVTNATRSASCFEGRLP